jgi:zinc protease
MSGGLPLACAAALALLGACQALPDSKPLPPRVEDGFDVVLPRLERTVLGSGLTVLSSENADGGLVHLALVMRAGYDYDPPKKEGLARLAGELLELAARSPDHAARFAAVGATPQVTITRAGAIVAIEVLPADAARAAGVLADFVRAPLPIAERLESVRAARRSALARALGSPDELAAIAIARVFSPWIDRAGALGYGSRASLDAITAGDLEQYFAQARNVRDAAFIATGAIEPLQAESWALPAFAQWPSAQFRRPSGAAQVSPRERRIMFIPVAGMQQSLIVVGGLRPRPSDANAPMFDAALSRLVGRVNHLLREERRISYGIGKDVATESDAFVIPIRVRADKTAVALAEIRKELEISSGAMLDEWLAYRRMWTLSRWMDDLQQAASVAAHAREVFLHALALDSLQRNIVGLRELDGEDVKAAAAGYLDPSRLGVVVVGDPNIVRAQLGADIQMWSL